LSAQSSSSPKSPPASFTRRPSAGTQAGLAAGLILRGWHDVELIGVSADDPAAEIAGNVREIMRGVAQLLGPLEPPMPILVLDEYVGPGYGIPTFESNATLRRLARTEGILLDPVYTAKAMTACLDLIREDPKPTLFWHTGGQMALFDLSAGAE
jgi:D-cysteine desulfhydrase